MFYHCERSTTRCTSSRKIWPGPKHPTYLSQFRLTQRKLPSLVTPDQLGIWGITLQKCHWCAYWGHSHHLSHRAILVQNVFLCNISSSNLIGVVICSPECCVVLEFRTTYLVKFVDVIGTMPKEVTCGQRGDISLSYLRKFDGFVTCLSVWFSMLCLLLLIRSYNSLIQAPMFLFMGSAASTVLQFPDAATQTSRCKANIFWWILLFSEDCHTD